LQYRRLQGECRVVPVCQNVPGCSISQYFKRPKSDSHRNNFLLTTLSKSQFLLRVFSCKNGTNHKWLTYCEENHTLYCTVCLAFTKPGEKNPFISGTQDWKYVCQRVEEHERSNMHRLCAEAYFFKI